MTEEGRARLTHLLAEVGEPPLTRARDALWAAWFRGGASAVPHRRTLADVIQLAELLLVERAERERQETPKGAG